jgi:hypothetical protein
MRTNKLAFRFFLAGGVLIVTILACGIWSVLTFDRLASALVDTLDDNQETINVAVKIIYSLESEDRLLLEHLQDPESSAKSVINEERLEFERLFRELKSHMR